MVRFAAVFALVLSFSLPPASAHRITVVVGSGTLPTGEAFDVAAFDAGDTDRGLMRYRASASAPEIVIDVDCVSVSWSLSPLLLSHIIAVGGTDAEGVRHQAVFYDAGPGPTTLDHGRFMQAGNDSCGVTYGWLHPIDGVIDAS